MARAVLLAFLWVALLTSRRVQGYPGGAPEFVCVSMIPGHGQSQLQYDNPFKLTVSSETYSPGQTVRVTIEPYASSGVYIRGFLVQARPANDRESGTTVGSFTSGSGTDTICNGGGITQTYSAERGSQELVWFAPPESQPQVDIVFRASVVRRYYDFYTGVDSVIISPQPATTITTPPPTTTATTTSTTPTTTTTTTPATNTTTTTTTPTTTSTTTTSTTTPLLNTISAVSPLSSSSAIPSVTPPPTTTTTTTTASTPTTTTSQSAADTSTTSSGQQNTGPVGGVSLTRSDSLSLMLMTMMTMTTMMMMPLVPSLT